MFILALAQPPSQPCLADSPAPDTGPNPTTCSHPPLSSAEPPLGFGQLRLGAQVRGSQASVPLKFRLVGFMLLLLAVWIFLGLNSLKSWQPVSALCCPHCAHLSLRSMTCGIGHVHPHQAPAKPSVSALVGGGHSTPTGSVIWLLFLHPLTGCLGELDCDPDSLCLRMIPAEVTCHSVRAGMGIVLSRITRPAPGGPHHLCGGPGLQVALETGGRRSPGSTACVVLGADQQVLESLGCWLRSPGMAASGVTDAGKGEPPTYRSVYPWNLFQGLDSVVL